jgi:hypothetical protein
MPMQSLGLRSLIERSTFKRVTTNLDRLGLKVTQHRRFCNSYAWMRNQQLALSRTSTWQCSQSFTSMIQEIGCLRDL